MKIPFRHECFFCLKKFWSRSPSKLNVKIQEGMMTIKTCKKCLTLFTLAHQHETKTKKVKDRVDESI